MSMELTKRLWEQPTDKGVLAYHIIQSFSPGEATPDQVHEIGCEFAQRFLADRFECTVSTHLDKGHLHNHIVVNSVSYADGKMFRNNFDTYYHGIRQVSDELCRENRLSVIETDGKGKSYDEWLSGQAGKPTIRGMVRKDVEQAIAAADSFDGFILELQNMGYTVKYGPRVEHMAVRHKDAQRNIRIDRLDPRFSETALREYYHKLHRMPTEMQQEYRQENAPAKPKWQPTELQPPVQRVRYRGKLPRRYPKVSGFMACYYHYCALLRKAYHGKSTKRCYFLLREDFLLFSRYQQQTKFLWENHIETMDELLAYKENAEVQIQQLARQRKVLYRQKREPERAAREEKIKSLTQQMKALRHEVYICSDIETDAAEVQEKLRQAEIAAQEERNEVKQDVMRSIHAKGRDNARTPMQWDGSKNAGFTVGEPWLKVNPNYLQINAAGECNTADSVFAYYKALIALRKKYPIFAEGDYQLLMGDDPDVFAYKRTWKEQTLYVICNFRAKELNEVIPEEYRKGVLLISNYAEQGSSLKPYEARIYLEQRN